MASGRAHSTVAMVSLAIIPVAVRIWQPEWPLGKIVVGLVAGLMMTPDLDVDHETIEEYRLSRLPIIGFAVATVWQMIWLPYARLLPHRDALSHWPIIGTAGRIAYLAAWLLLLSWLMGACGGEPAIDWVGIWRYLWPWMFAGWAVQDVGHIIWDVTPGLRSM